MSNDDIDIFAAVKPQSAPLEPEIVEEETLPALPSPVDLDISPVARSLVPYQKHIARMVKEAQAIRVTDAESQKVAVTIESRNKRLWKDLERERERFRAPFLAHLSQIQNLFKALQDPLRQNQELVRTERGKYDHQLDLARREKQAALREEQRQLQAKLDAEAQAQREEAERKAQEAAEKLKTETNEATRVALEKTIADETTAAQAPTPQVAPIIVEKATVIRTAEGLSYTKFKWVCTVTDPDLVPRDCCEPSQKLLDAKLKAGVREIPGCLIEEVPVPVTRV